jgi:hypothetical protein
MRAGTSAAVGFWADATGTRVKRSTERRQPIRRFLVRCRLWGVVMVSSKSEVKRIVVEVGLGLTGATLAAGMRRRHR